MTIALALNPTKRYVITLDDDPMMHQIIERTLGIRSLSFSSPEELSKVIANYHPIAAFIDLNLENGQCGLDIIPALRKEWSFCPLLVITSDPTGDAVARALNAGCDDFIQKPLRPTELLARLQTRLDDYSERQSARSLRMGDTHLDPNLRIVEGPAGKRYLSPTEINLLLCLWQAKGTVVSREKLKRQAWKGLVVSDNAFDRKLFELRKILEDVHSALSVQSIYGKGLRLEKKV